MYIDTAFYEKFGVEVDFPGHPLLDVVNVQKPDPVLLIDVEAGICRIENGDPRDWRRRLCSVRPGDGSWLRGAFFEKPNEHLGRRLDVLLKNVAKKIVRRQAAAKFLGDPALTTLSASVIAVDDGDAIGGKTQLLFLRQAIQMLDWAERAKHRTGLV